MRFGRISGEQGGLVRTVVEVDGQLRGAEGDPFGGSLHPGRPVQGCFRWLPPVDPPALICIGLNYRQHAIECGLPMPQEPVVFMKNPSAAIGHLEPIRIPRVCEDELDYECELAVVIGRACCDVPRERALDHVLGYAAANDVSARIWQMQRGGTQWVRGKSFDTFAPIGPLVVTPDVLAASGASPAAADLPIRTVLNGEVVQESSTADMIFDVPALVSFLSQGTTLKPGTVIMTGTPQGIGWTRQPRKLLRAGDTVTIELGGVGTLTNRVGSH